MHVLTKRYQADYQYFVRVFDHFGGQDGFQHPPNGGRYDLLQAGMARCLTMRNEGLGVAEAIVERRGNRVKIGRGLQEHTKLLNFRCERQDHSHCLHHVQLPWQAVPDPVFHAQLLVASPTVANGVVLPGNAWNAGAFVFEQSFPDAIGKTISGADAFRMRVVIRPDGSLVTGFPL